MIQTNENQKNEEITSHQGQLSLEKESKQMILFGSPGTSKSFQLKQKFENDKRCRVVRTVFHPEYTYGDFMGKLVPVTKYGKVEYRYFAGVFMKALGMALSQLIDAHAAPNEAPPEKPTPTNLQKTNFTVLIIEEINRGNSAAIFGTLFQLLDRTPTSTSDPLGPGWSEYSVALTQLEFENLLNEIGITIIRYTDDQTGVTSTEYKYRGESCTKLDGNNKLSKILQYVCGLNLFSQTNDGSTRENTVKEIKLPPNFLIRATMNTSDNSVYVTDAAFKRRWDWKYIDWQLPIESDLKQQEPNIEEYLKRLKINSKFIINNKKYSWPDLVRKVNDFIRSQHKRIRNIEDKQIGYYFIPYQENGLIPQELIIDKLAFFLWDTVFDRDKKPLTDLLNSSENSQKINSNSHNHTP